MVIQKRRYIVRLGIVTIERFSMHFRQRIMERLAETYFFVQAGVEAVEEAQLELIRALEKISQFTEGARILWCDRKPGCPPELIYFYSCSYYSIHFGGLLAD